MKKICILALTVIVAIGMFSMFVYAERTKTGVPLGEPICLESVRYSGYFVNTWAGKNANGTKITLYRFDGTTDQRYVIEDLGNGEYYIRAYSSNKGKGRVLDIYWGNHNSSKVVEGMPIDIWTPSASEDKFQKFLLKENEDGSVSFLVASNPELAVAVNKGKNGSQLLIKKYSDTDAAVKFYVCTTQGTRINITSDDQSNVVLGTPMNAGISATVSSSAIKSTESVVVKVDLSAVALCDTVTVKIGQAEKTVKTVINTDRIGQTATITFPGIELVKANGVSEKQYDVIITCSNSSGSITKTVGALKVTSEFKNPLQAIGSGRTNIVTQGFGSNAYYETKDHLGVDYSGVSSYVTAITDGQVVDIFTGYGSGYGNTVILKHVIDNKEVFTLYGHMADGSLKVSVGDFVSAGQILGVMGTTGNSTGAHVHVSVMQNYKVGTIPAGYYNTTFSGNESISYKGITFYSAVKFIETKGAIIK